MLVQHIEAAPVIKMLLVYLLGVRNEEAEVLGRDRKFWDRVRLGRRFIQNSEEDDHEPEER